MFIFVPICGITKDILLEERKIFKMKNILKKTKILFLVATFAVAGVLAPVGVSSVQAQIQGGVNEANPNGPGGESATLFGEGSIFTNIINALLFIIGALSVVMLIYGGIRYTTSGGNSNSVTAAKNTIIYAIIGLIVAFLAFAVVNWVLNTL